MSDISKYTPLEPNTIMDILQSLTKTVCLKGGDAADALLIQGQSLSLSQRLGKLDILERSENFDLGLRVFMGGRQALVSSTDWDVESRETLVERALEMVRVVPEDPYCGLADPDSISHTLPQLDLWSSEEPSIEHLRTLVQETEEAALAVPGITNSEGAEGGWGWSTMFLVGTNGFQGVYSRSSNSLSVVVLAGEGTQMERDYEFSSAVYLGDLWTPQEIGRRAGEQAVRRLHARKVATQRVPVVYDPRVSNSLLRHLSSAINGTAIARDTSFLKTSLGEVIFAEGIEVVDDPFVRRGLRSRPFDSEGICPSRMTVVENGRLTTWLLDLRSARQLGLSTTGHAVRGVSSPPSPAPSNLTLSPGQKTQQHLIGEIKQGFYVTELIGMGVNTITGDYSRGAAGFWIEEGVVSYPVSEVTLAGNLRDMFRTLEPANDLVRRYGIDAPTVRVEGLTIAGH